MIIANYVTIGKGYFLLIVYFYFAVNVPRRVQCQSLYGLYVEASSEAKHPVLLYGMMLVKLSGISRPPKATLITYSIWLSTVWYSLIIQSHCTGRVTITRKHYFNSLSICINENLYLSFRTYKYIPVHTKTTQNWMNVFFFVFNTRMRTYDSSCRCFGYNSISYCVTNHLFSIRNLLPLILGDSFISLQLN